MNAKKKKEKKAAKKTEDARATHIQSLYDGGNFASLHQQIPPLLADETLPSESRRKIQDLLDRVTIDAVAIRVGLASVGFITLVAFLTLSAK